MYLEYLFSLLLELFLIMYTLLMLFFDSPLSFIFSFTRKIWKSFFSFFFYIFLLSSSIFVNHFFEPSFLPLLKIICLSLKNFIFVSYYFRFVFFFLKFFLFCFYLLLLFYINLTFKKYNLNFFIINFYLIIY